MNRMTMYPSGKSIEVTDEEFQQGVTHVQCPACQGTGTFWITDTDSQGCVRCSTRGKVAVTVL